jgi:hypothetical protein
VELATLVCCEVLVAPAPVIDPAPCPEEPVGTVSVPGAHAIATEAAGTSQDPEDRHMAQT